VAPQSITIRRDRNGIVTARSPYSWQTQHTLASDLLQRLGFVPRRWKRNPTVLVLPAHLDPADQVQRASSAAATLRATGHQVLLARDLSSEHPHIALPVDVPGWNLQEALKDTITGTAHSDEVARALFEVTAPVSGVLAVVTSVVDQVEWWWSGIGPAYVHSPEAARLRELAERVKAINSDLGRLQEQLAVMDHRREAPDAPPRLAAARGASPSTGNRSAHPPAATAAAHTARTAPAPAGPTTSR
jgi:hypothetical protein